VYTSPYITLPVLVYNSVEGQSIFPAVSKVSNLDS